MQRMSLCHSISGFIGKEVERINTIKNTAYDGIKIDLKPCAQYNLVPQNYQPGLTLRIKF